MTEDTNLVQEAQQGNLSAFATLIRRYQSATYALALQRLGAAGAAEEAAQEAFVAAFQKLSQLRDPTRFGAWLRAITLRRCADGMRSRKRVLDTVAPLNEALANPTRQAHEELFGIERMIHELPQGLRAAAVLCLQEDVAPKVAA